jgi:hypothetical protein
MSRVINQPFLRTARAFPEERQQFYQQINKAYVDIANCVNNRIVSTFPTSGAAITGEEWFISENRKQQGLREVFSFTTTAAITHGIIFSNIYGFVRNWGEFTDGTNWYGLIHASTTAIAGQITFYVTSSQIIFVTGAGAPSLTKGTIVLEWLTQP